MGKIGIITIYGNINYGSKLQSYALQRTLEKLGYYGENIIINISGQKNQRKKLWSVIRKPTIIFKFISRTKYHKRAKLFDDYLKNNINVSEFTVKDIQTANQHGIQHYYKYICGSDQIWAPNQFNENYFLSFVSDIGNKIAYAPSIGLPKIPKELIVKYKELIGRIDFVSIREEDGANIIKRITGKEVPVVVDPTLLLAKDDWRKHSISPKVKSPYILCYFLGSNKNHRRWVEKLSKKTGYEIFVLPFATYDFYWGDKRIFEAGPREFLGLVDGAEIICTDSFHGMLFSINLNKEFYSFLRFKEGDKLNQNSRVLNFLEKLNLKNRIVDLNVNNDYEPIKWSQVNSQIEAERAKSLEFLKQSLREK